MVIKVSTLLQHNSVVQDDPAPVLGGPLNTNNFPISNGSNPVDISGNEYPTNTGTAGQVLTTDGFGNLSWQSPPGGATTLTGDVTGSGTGTIVTTISPSGVTASTYGSSSVVGTFTVNSKGQITSAANAPIVITPAAAGLGNVTNSLQVINAGGAPSIQEGTGAPVGTAASGAVYIDLGVTNGNGISVYNGSSWNVVASRPNLYSEKVNGYIAPVALGLDSVAIGSGAETASTATGSLAIGLQSLARNQGGIVQANGRFSSNGDAQAGRYMLRNTTVGSTPAELFIDGSSVRLTLADDSTWTFKITITAHRLDAGNGHAGYTAAGVIYRGAGPSTTAIQGSIQKVVLAESNPVWDINISADSGNGSLKILVTGETNKIIRWVALVETVEITN